MAAKKLTWQQVNEIREKWIPGSYPTRRLGREYGVSHSTIHEIVSGKIWKDPQACQEGSELGEGNKPE